MFRTPVGRRSFLRGLAASALTLPIAREMFGEGMLVPKRLVLFMQNNGTQQANFWPSGDEFTSPILEPILSNDSVASKTNLVKGVYVPGDANGTNGNQHDMGFARMYTGEPLKAIGGYPWGGGPSVDQILAKEWGIDTLTLAVLASEVEPHTKPGFSHRRSFSYVGPGAHKIPTIDPYAAYEQVFPAKADEGAGAARRRLLTRKSVLDAVTGNMREISSRLGAAERAKLDLHLTAVRQVEAQLSKSIAGGGDRPACSAKPKAPRDIAKIDPDLLVDTDAAIVEMVGNQIDLATAALICGVRRIATMQFGFGGGKWRFKWEGIDMNCHDDVAHKDTSDEGRDPKTTERVIKMNHWYATQVMRMAKQLDAVPEGSGTMLDNTLIVWANELGRGDHNLKNVPIVLIGKAGGAISKGGRVIDEGKQVFNRLGCTILNVMGKKVAGFGDVDDCGVFAGLS